MTAATYPVYNSCNNNPLNKQVMRVILDVNRPSSVSCGVQSCSSVEGFLEVKKNHPEDEFVIDPESYEVYQTYMERLVMQKVYNFCDEMCIEQDVLSAMIQWNSVKMNFLPLWWINYEDR